jgi:hypothetical protein
MNINLKDLLETCLSCEGTGKKPDARKPAADQAAGSKPWASFTGKDTDCDQCGGYGRDKLTPTGQSLLDFIRILQGRKMI